MTSARLPETQEAGAESLAAFFGYPAKNVENLSSTLHPKTGVGKTINSPLPAHNFASTLSLNG